MSSNRYSGARSLAHCMEESLKKSEISAVLAWFGSRHAEGGRIL
jgi:hypothetical protein